MNDRKLILYIACSLDGYISKPNDDLSFLDRMQQEGEDYGYGDFITDVDTIIIGHKTYQWVIDQGFEYPHHDKDVYVITRTGKPKENNINYYAGDVKKLVSSLKEKEGRNIYCDGGAEIVNLLLKEKLFDELIISVVPVILGEGTRLFNDNYPEQNLELISATSFDKGMVQLRYKIEN
ncbi:MAG: dihydrofolate reductase [Salinivirgaceae bacterium]|nr:MAG: dihydrofolate reductase [Salinivirgaceae bacterium]